MYDLFPYDLPVKFRDENILLSLYLLVILNTQTLYNPSIGCLTINICQIVKVNEKMGGIFKEEKRRRKNVSLSKRPSGV